MKIGLMGGTFDPPHKAHIAMAQNALSQFGLSKVIFMTGGNPPHKTTMTDARIRHRMVELMIEGIEDFCLCDYEIEKNGYSYTADTLKYLNEKYPDDSFYFIIGGDSYDAIFTWYKPEEILKRCTILVCQREGRPTKKEVEKFSKEHNASLFLVEMESVKISSTDIRQKAEKGGDISTYLDDEVYDYIKRNALYEKKEGNMKDRLKKLLDEKRFCHSLGVAKEAVKMAKHYGVDEEKAYIAGLLHDCAKNLSPEEVKTKCYDLSVELDEFERENPGLIHAKVGAQLIKTEFLINDEEISNAICYHTIGRVGMSDLEKIIFVADMIEEGRNYPEVEFLRKAAYKNLDTALFECVDAIIKFNNEKGKTIHPMAYKIREDCVLRNVKRLKKD